MKNGGRGCRCSYVLSNWKIGGGGGAGGRSRLRLYVSFSVYCCTYSLFHCSFFPSFFFFFLFFNPGLCVVSMHPKPSHPPSPVSGTLRATRQIAKSGTCCAFDASKENRAALLPKRTRPPSCASAKRLTDGPFPRTTLFFTAPSLRSW